MAHEIENAQIAWRGEMPWHGIGAEMTDPNASVDDWLKAANLDWEVVGTPLTATMDDGTVVEIPEKLAFIRSHDHKVMTLASEDWKPLQNREAVDFMQHYVRAGGAELETVGALNDGKVVWGLARLNHDFTVAGKHDKVKGYLMITTPHVVGKAIKVETTTVRVVCANTMRLAQGSSEVNFRQSHLRDFDVNAARAAVAAAHEGLAEAERRAKILAGLKIGMEDACRKVIVPVFEPHLAAPENGKWLKEMLDGSEKMPLRLRQIMDSIENAPGAIKDNGWGVLNGVTHFCDHRSGHTQQSRLNRAWGGDYATKKLQVEEKLLQLAA